MGLGIFNYLPEYYLFMNLGIELNSMAEMVNKELKKNLQFGKRSTLYDAMRYLIFAGGKRLRPIIAVGSPKTICVAFIFLLNLSLSMISS